MANRERDPANVAAAAQEADERKLLRKKSIRRDEGAGVSFSDEPTELKENSSENSEDLNPDLESSEVELDNSVESEKPVSPETSGGKGKIEIISDGTYVGTSVILNNKKLSNPDVLIRISSKEVSFQIFQVIRSKIPLV